MIPQHDLLEEWIGSFPYTAVKEEATQLQEQIQDLNLRLYSLNEAIQMYEKYKALADQRDRQREARESNGSTPAKEEGPSVVAIRPSVREGLRTLLGNPRGKEWHTDQLFDALVRRGWLRGDPQGKNNMFAMLSVMAKASQIERVRTGWYRIPESEEQEV